MRDTETDVKLQAVDDRIHSDDHIFSFLKSHPDMHNVEEARTYYMKTGAETVNLLSNLLGELGLSSDFRLLEFASGYGCVSRHFPSLMPLVQVTPCDIHPAAIEFLTQLGFYPIQSHSNPSDLRIEPIYDVIFALSFFSHMPLITWRAWLARLCELIVPGGFLLFTTHGYVSSVWHPLDSDGFYFTPGSEQIDIDPHEYGTTVTSFDYVHHQIRSIPDVRLVQFREALWWKHQDLYIIRKRPK